MLASIARAIFGSANDRSLKAYQRRVPQINALEPAMEALSDAALAAKTVEFRDRLANGATLDELLPEAFAVVREAGKRTLGQRHFDVQLVGGMVLHDGKISRDEDRRGQDPGRHPAGLPERAGRQGRACRDRERLPGPPRRRVDGADLPVPRHERRRDRARSGRRDQARAIRRRHHLRHQQRVRLRLPARQHEVPAGGHGPARLLLRHRRRGGLAS